MLPGGDVTTSGGVAGPAPSADDEGRARQHRRSARRVAGLVLLGCLLVQAAWIATLPPYRGNDEVDHAYRAAQVAGGDWSVSQVSLPGGRGQLVPVPEAMVRAARPVCTNLPYMQRDNCYPVRAVGDGRVLVGTSAAAYNPVFYAVMGAPTHLADGTAALYGMRTIAAVLCALLVAAAAYALRLWASTAWPLVALLTAAAPIVTYSLSVAAPNGIEIAACLTLWSALLGCATARGRSLHARPLLVLAVLGATVACIPRSLGPFWVLAIALTTLPVVGWLGIRELCRAHPRLIASGALLVLSAAVGASVWTRTAGTQGIPPDDMDIANRWTATLAQVPLWFLQGVAAFPRRSDPAPLGVYLAVGLVSIALLVLGFRRAERRLRVVMTACLVFALGVPFVFTLTSIAFAGPLWQGRYGAPYHLGVFLLAGLALDRRPLPLRPLAVPWVIALAGGQLWSLLHVLLRERSSGPYAGSSAWNGPPVWVVVCLVAAASLLLARAAWLAADGDRAPAPGISG